jgi:hypothetical protein
VTFVAGLIAGLLIVLVAVWLRDRSERGRRGEILSDEHIRAIEREGRVDVEDPLDLDRIREEETRFWEESWDEPEEW